MSTLQKADSTPPPPETKMGRFLAERGILLKKQFREFAKVRAYPGTLAVSTLIFEFPNSTEPNSYGVKVEHENPDKWDETALIDFDEMEEMLRAIKYLYEIAKEIEGKTGDYTEFLYSTKDRVRVGFYQTVDGTQRAFFDVQPRGGMLFISFEQLREVFDGLREAYKHLKNSGAVA